MVEILGVTESATRILRREIITGQILPGTKLNETELSNRYGVSRPPLREAFRRLEYEKLVVTVPRKGTYVTKLSIQDCRNVYFTRHTIECAGIDVIASTKGFDFGSLRKTIHDELHTGIPREDDAEGLLSYYKEIANFHWQLVELGGNRWLTHCYQSIGATLTRYQILYYTIPGTRQPAIDDHIQILHFIEEGKCQKAKKLLVFHITEGLDKLIDKMRGNKLCENHDEPSSMTWEP